MRRLNVLVVEDDPDLLRALRRTLEDAGYGVIEADSVRAGVTAFRERTPDLALLDHALADGTSFDLLDAFAPIDPSIPVVVLTGSGTIEVAVEAMKRGVSDFLPKPASPEALLAAVETALAGREPPGLGEPRLDPFAGASDLVRALAGQATRAAGSGAALLISGEAGTGKGVLAHWIHQHGPRAGGPYVTLSCAGMPPELLEIELFGSEHGSRTASRAGVVETASGGTLVLEDIDELDPAAQGSLLRVLDERRSRRVGAAVDRRVNVRVVATTSRDLDERVRDGAFRADLRLRLGGITIPPLRERAEDIPFVVTRLLAHMPARARRVTFSPAAIAALRAYAWPGNVRELRNVLEHAVLHHEARELGPADLLLQPPEARGARRAEPAGAGALEDRPRGAREVAAVRDLQRSLVLQVVEEERFRIEEAALRLGMPRSTLYQKLKEYGVRLPRGRRRSP